MLLDLFILFEVTALVLFVLALCFNNIKFEVSIVMMIISVVLFFVLAVSAFNIEQTVAVVDGMTVTTMKTMHSSFPVAWLNIGLGFIALIFSFYLIFYAWKND